MSVIHIGQIKNAITTLFEGKIDLSDVNSAHAEKSVIENFFITRGLAAYAIHYLAQTTPAVAAVSITDGGEDNGIDAIYYDEADKRLYIVQSKWIQSGSGEPDNGEVKKYIGGIKDLFNLSFDRFNSKVKGKAEIITQALNDPNTRYEVVLAYTGINSLAEPSTRDLEDLESEMNDAGDVLSVTVLNQANLYESLTSSISGDPIALDIGLKSWGKIEQPYNGFYGQVDGGQILQWWIKNRSRLFAKNLRGVLGDTEVNSEIKETITKFPDRFWYFNNGITIVSKKVSKTMAGGADNTYGTFHCEDISVVNGAQTVGTIGKTSSDKVANIFVPVRIISLESSYENFGEDITRTNNRQNRIENRDFVALDPEQERIRTELAIDKISYHLMRSDNTIKDEKNFDLIESTTALACASEDPSLYVQLKREIGKLWEDLERSPYKALFNARISGMYVWRCVQTQRYIDQSLNSIAAEIGKDAGRDYGILIHGNRMISALVFSKIGPAQFNDPSFDFADEINEAIVNKLTKESFEKLKGAVDAVFPNAILPTLFKNLTKCKRLAGISG